MSVNVTNTPDHPHTASSCATCTFSPSLPTLTASATAFSPNPPFTASQPSPTRFFALLVMLIKALMISFLRSVLNSRVDFAGELAGASLSSDFLAAFSGRSAESLEVGPRIFEAALTALLRVSIADLRYSAADCVESKSVRS